MSKAFVLCRLILIMANFAYVGVVCKCDLQSPSTPSEFNLVSKEIEELQFIKGTRATFVCPLTLQGGNYVSADKSRPANLEEAIKVVYFYKGSDSSLPLATFDNRGGELFKTVHLNEDLTGMTIIGKRNISRSVKSRFNISVDYVSKEAKLSIDNVEENDEGFYKCRADYRWSGTTVKRFRMELIVPPEQLIIRDRTDYLEAKIIGKSNIIGPYAEEFPQVRLSCDVFGVKPEPLVHWYEGKTLLDDEYDHLEIEHRFADPIYEEDEKEKVLKTKNKREVISIGFEYRHGLINVSNTLVVGGGKLKRSDYRRKFRCVSWNTDLVPPVEREVTLDMILRPVNAKIVVGSPDAIVAGHNAGLVCRSGGSLPFAQLSWYKNSVLVTDKIDGRFDKKTNESISVLRFVASIEDDRAEFECHATNIRLPEEIGTVKDSIRIQVHYPPQVEVACIHPLPFAENETALLEEGKRVKLFCSIIANPPINSSIIWLLNNKRLDLQICDKLNCDITGPMLTIISLDEKLHNGNYSCFAENVVGRSVSEVFQLTVSYVPRCNQTKTVYYVAINETVKIDCKVTAYPTNVFYDWYLNQSNPIAAANSFARFSKNRTVFYTPKNRFDYGNLSCDAYNIVGRMKGFCTYTLIPSNRPDSVNSCIAEQSDNFEEEEVEMESWVATTASTIVNSSANIEVKVKPKLVYLIIICKIPYNGGEDSTTICTADINHVNDLRPFWSGDSSATSLLSDGLTYQCTFRPPVKANLHDKYSFSIISLNKVGPAEGTYNFTSQIRPRPALVTQKRGSVNPKVSNDNAVMWDNFIDITTNVSYNVFTSKNITAIKENLSAKNKFVKEVKNVLKKKSTYVYVFLFLMIGFATYKLTMVSVHAHKLRVARAQIYDSTGEEGNAGNSSTEPQNIPELPLIPPPPPPPLVLPPMPAQRYSAQLKHAHTTYNGLNFVRSEFGWSDPLSDCEEFHHSETEEDIRRIQTAKAMEVLVKSKRKSEKGKTKLMTLVEGGSDDESKVCNINKFCLKKKRGAKNGNKKSFAALCNIHGVHSLPNINLPCAKCALERLNAQVSVIPSNSTSTVTADGNIVFKLKNASEVVFDSLGDIPPAVVQSPYEGLIPDPVIDEADFRNQIEVKTSNEMVYLSGTSGTTQTVGQVYNNDDVNPIINCGCSKCTFPYN